MTRVTVHRHNGILYGFEVRGHSGYAEAGHDIVCAAVSAMTMLVVNTIESSFGIKVIYKADKKNAGVCVKVPILLDGASEDKYSCAAEGLLKGYLLQLNDMAREYRGYIEVNVTDDEPSD